MAVEYFTYPLIDGKLAIILLVIVVVTVVWIIAKMKEP